MQPVLPLDFPAGSSTLQLLKAKRRLRKWSRQRTHRTFVVASAFNASFPATKEVRSRTLFEGVVDQVIMHLQK
jgi:hypothetical protein